MNENTRKAVGVDVSKAHLDAHRLPDGEAKRFANDARGFEELAAWVGEDAACVVYESTGPWHRALEEALAHRLPLARVNAKRARRFAEAAGQEAKTDAADAQALALMGMALRLRRVEPAPPERRDLDELHTARDALVRDRVAVLNRLGQARHPLVKRQLERRRTQIDRQIKALEAEAARVVAASPALARQVEVLRSLPGVAFATAAGLLAEMPELGRLDAKAVASLAGVAPMARESGQWKGRSFIRGGRAKVRRMLYMASLSAIRHNPDFRRKHGELVARGKTGKVALVAIMRKLLVLANALLAQDRLWTPEPPARSTDASAAAASEHAGGPAGLGEGSLGDRSQGPQGHPPATAPAASAVRMCPNASQPSPAPA